MKKEYETPMAEKMEFNYTDAVVASQVCKSGLKKVYTDTGKPNCSDRYLGDVDSWVGDTF